MPTASTKSLLADEPEGFMFAILAHLARRFPLVVSVRSQDLAKHLGLVALRCELAHLHI